MATWGNTGTGDWDTPSNWQGGTLPGYETITINNGGTVTIGTSSGSTETVSNVKEIDLGGGTSTSTINVYGTLSGNVMDVLSKGVLNIEPKGNFSFTNGLTVSAGGAFNVSGTASVAGGAITVNGTLDIASGATLTGSDGLLVNGTASIEGTYTDSSGGIGGSGTFTVDGGTLGNASNLTTVKSGSPKIIISSGGSVYLTNPNSTTSITFGPAGSGQTNTLEVPSYIGNITVPITGFGLGDAIALTNGSQITGLTITAHTGNAAGTYSIGLNGTSIVLKNVTLAAGVSTNNLQALDNKGTYELVACFLEGTAIATPDGTKLVETLVPGDLVITLVDGEKHARPVKWVGHRHVKPGDLSADDAHPIRIKACAFGDAQPSRDLLVTAEHCILAGGGLIPARLLVNGCSIFADQSIASFTYYHVELEEHGILLAEDLAVESYLDTGNRGNFANASISSLRPLFANPAQLVAGPSMAAPLLVEPCQVQPVWQELNCRAQALAPAAAIPAPALSEDPDLCLVAQDGVEIRPLRILPGKALFMLPAGMAGLALASRTARPNETRAPYLNDRRDLGVLVGEITLHTGRAQKRITAHLHDASLAGWYVPEAAERRWTNGFASLPVATAPGQASILEVQILQAGPYLALSARREAA